MPLFEVVITEKATKKQVDEGGPAEKIVMGPLSVMAPDRDVAIVAAVMGTGAAMETSRAEVKVRPFA